MTSICKWVIHSFVKCDVVSLLFRWISNFPISHFSLVFVSFPCSAIRFCISSDLLMTNLATLHLRSFYLYHIRALFMYLCIYLSNKYLRRKRVYFAKHKSTTRFSWNCDVLICNSNDASKIVMNVNKYCGFFFFHYVYSTFCVCNDRATFELTKFNGIHVQNVGINNDSKCENVN